MPAFSAFTRAAALLGAQRRHAAPVTASNFAHAGKGESPAFSSQAAPLMTDTVTCRRFGCEWTGQRRELAEHVKECHE